MAYLKPPLFTRTVFNRIAMRFGFGGSSMLAVAGRRSGATETIPVIPIEHGGARYVVSTRGESEWVRNLRAAGECELGRKGKAERFRSVEIPVAERPPVIEAYRAAAGRAVVGYWKKLPDPADHPVFRLEPVA